MVIIKKIKYVPIILTFILLLASGACTFPLPERDGTDGNGSVQTAAAQTIEAFQTQQALATLVSQLTAVAQTSIAQTTSPAGTPTPSQTSSPIPSATPIVIVVTPTTPPLPCNWAEFVADITISDGTIIGANETFLKIWRLRNIGRCTWTRDYTLSFERGNQMAGVDHVQLAETVEPGETADLGVWLRSPDEPGTYTGYWRLRDDEGNYFGIGDNADGVFWVRIRVEEEIEIPGDNPYVLAYNYCEAEWRSTTGRLPCPSSINDFQNGSIYRSLSPVFEGGYEDNEATLVTIPSDGIGGMISGHFPELEIVDEHDHFRAVIGCLEDSPECDVTFQLNYEDEEGDIHNLGSWVETSDGEWREIRVDLEDLRDEEIELILTVHNNGDSEDDRAFWLLPALID